MSDSRKPLSLTVPSPFTTKSGCRKNVVFFLGKTMNTRSFQSNCVSNKVGWSHAKKRAASGLSAPKCFNITRLFVLLKFLTSSARNINCAYGDSNRQSANIGSICFIISPILSLASGTKRAAIEITIFFLCRYKSHCLRRPQRRKYVLYHQ